LILPNLPTDCVEGPSLKKWMVSICGKFLDFI
jgi:hypothetical protein